MSIKAKNKSVCVHGHFYQPPRENPWTGAVEPEESAFPYRDWNSRVASECYAPNAASPVLDGSGRIRAMSDNYELMSFNFGPTLLRWLKDQRPRLYGLILDGDRKSALRLGRGNAFAQPYVHAILPLASARDKRTLVAWGIADFRSRFGRDPEGMWLPETAVDEASLDALAEAGLRFAVLAPHQCARVRTLGEETWKDMTAETLNPSRPYLWRSKTAEGRALALFFYHGVVSKGVETGESISGGEVFFHKVLGRFLPDDSSQLVTVASDGEFYGHHHRRGHQALGHALERLRAEGVEPVNFASFLDRFPPPQEAEIRPGTSWSCPHGLGRWKEDCGCRSAAHPAWNQRWRGPLREALDRLAQRLDELFEEKASEWLTDPWEARNGYIEVMTDPSTTNIDRYLERHAKRRLSPDEARHALASLEMQKQRLFMFTSCGWFFDDVSGLESVQLLKHAARAVELASGLGADLSLEFKEGLARAESNLPRFKNGARIYERLVEPAAVDAERVAAHWALLEHLRLAEAASPAPLFSPAREDALRAEKQGLAGRDSSLSWARLRLTEPGRTRTFETLVHQLDRLDIACWVLTSPVGREEAEGLRASFTAQESDAFRAAISGRFGQKHHGLDSLLGGERRQAMRLLMPDPRSRGGVLRRWCDAVADLRQRRGDGSGALELLSQCRSLDLLPQELPFIDFIRSHALVLLEKLLTSDAEEDLARALRWITVFEEAGLAVDVWELQEFHWRWLARLAGEDVPPAKRAAALALGEKLGFSAAVLAGTEAFPAW